MLVINVIKSKKQIISLFEEGKVKKSFPLILFFKNHSNNKKLNLAFSVGKKNIPLAVNRNKIKRFLRELCIKENFLTENFGGFSCVVVYSSKEMPTYHSLKKDLVSLFSKLPV